MEFHKRSQKNTNGRLVKDDGIMPDRAGHGLKRKIGKVDNLLIQRRGLINGPSSSEQDRQSGARMEKNKNNNKKPLASLLKRGISPE